MSTLDKRLGLQNSTGDVYFKQRSTGIDPRNKLGRCLSKQFKKTVDKNIADRNSFIDKYCEKYKVAER
jgi:hypothetical protein